MISTKEAIWQDEWHADLLGCCSEPYLCMSSHHECINYGNHVRISAIQFVNMLQKVYSTKSTLKRQNILVYQKLYVYQL